MAEPAAPAVLLAQAWELACVDPVRAAVPARLLAASGDTLAPWGWWHLAFAEMRIGKLASGVAALTQAEHGFAASGDLRGQRFVREAQAIRLRREERAAEALALQAQIDSEMGGEQSSLDLYIAHSSRALTYRDLGRADDALRHLHAARDAAEASGNAGARITALGNLGSCHLELYNLDDAREMSLQAFSAALGAGSPHNLLAVTANLVLTHYALGEHRQAHAMAQFLTDHPDELPPDALERGRTAIALGHLAVGEVDEAVAWLERGEHCPVADREGVTLWTWLHMRCSLARGDAAAARALGERTLAERARLGLGDGPFDLMELHRALADACEGLGDTPALLHSASKGPSACAAAAPIEPRSPRSMRWHGKHFPAGGAMSKPVTRAPLAASRAASIAPMPLATPVTAMRRSSSGFGFMALRSASRQCRGLGTALAQSSQPAGPEIEWRP